MTTFKNGTKEVNIVTDNGFNTPIFRCFYVQLYNGEYQVLDSKDYTTFKRAEKWAVNQLKK